MTDQDTNRVIRSVTKNLLIVIVPFFVSFMVMIVVDHFTIKECQKHKVDKLEWQQNEADLLLFIERKTRAYESLGVANAKDIQLIFEEIEEYQEKIDQHIIKAFAQRGGDNTLPEF